MIPVIIDGTPPVNFPPTLRYEIVPDRTVTHRPVTILGPDFRESGDGKHLGLAKVVAGLIGVGTDDVFRRAERARRQRNWFWSELTGIFLLLAVAATGSAVYDWHQVKTNEAFLDATLKRATEIVDEAVAQTEKFNVPRAAAALLSPDDYQNSGRGATFGQAQLNGHFLRVTRGGGRPRVLKALNESRFPDGSRTTLEFDRTLNVVSDFRIRIFRQKS